MPLSILYTNKSGALWENAGAHPDPYVNKQGETITLNRWISWCSICDARFEILYSSRMNPSLGFNWAFRRTRCDLHRHPNYYILKGC